MWQPLKKRTAKEKLGICIEGERGPLAEPPQMCLALPAQGSDGHCLVLYGEAKGPALSLELDLVSAGEWRTIWNVISLPPHQCDGVK